MELTYSERTRVHVDKDGGLREDREECVTNVSVNNLIWVKGIHNFFVPFLFFQPFCKFEIISKV